MPSPLLLDSFPAPPTHIPSSPNPPPTGPPSLPLPPVPGPSRISEHEQLLLLSSLARRNSNYSVSSPPRRQSTLPNDLRSPRTRSFTHAHNESISEIDVNDILAAVDDTDDLDPAPSPQMSLDELALNHPRPSSPDIPSILSATPRPLRTSLSRSRLRSTTLDRRRVASDTFTPAASLPLATLRRPASHGPFLHHSSSEQRDSDLPYLQRQSVLNPDSDPDHDHPDDDSDSSIDLHTPLPYVPLPSPSLPLTSP